MLDSLIKGSELGSYSWILESEWNKILRIVQEVLPKDLGELLMEYLFVKKIPNIVSEAEREELKPTIMHMS